MICFPNAKINLGLSIIEKRLDGFHNIETILIPIPFFDVLEFKESDKFSIEVLGESERILIEENTIYKTWKKLNENFNIPAFEIQLLKNIPIKSGLGGGSSDASFFLKEINKIYKLGLSNKMMEEFIAEIGSDCPFFIKNKTALAEKKGENLNDINLNLNGKHLSLIKPIFSILTKEAYALSKVKTPGLNISEVVLGGISSWKHLLKNDFENVVKPLFPKLEIIKDSLYDLGAEYVSLSGSGPTIFAISSHKLELSNIEIENVGFVWQGKM